MLTSTRAGATVGIVLIAMLASSAPALADIYGNVDCSQSPTPDCLLGAGKTGHGGNPGSTPGGDNHTPSHKGSGGSSGSDGTGNGDTIIGGGSSLANCSYVPSDYQPPSGVIPAAFVRPSKHDATAVQPAVFARSSIGLRVVPVAAPGRSGAWYVWKCSGPGTADAVYRPPVWIPAGQQPGAVALPSPAELAAVAHRQLRLPTPAIAANPVGDQLVNLATWLWLSSGWGPVSATASVPGVSVTAVATPRSVVWSMGDGSTVTCTGAGTPFRPGTDPKAASPDCGHTYRVSSAGQPREAFRVAATVHWSVTWSGAGQSGTFPDMTTTGEAAFRVAEAQALNTGG
jgi:hypothetical protein